MHVSVGACSAGRGGEGVAGQGRAGFVKMLQIPCQIVFQIPFQILPRIDLLFENEAFVDFQIGNEAVGQIQRKLSILKRGTSVYMAGPKVSLGFEPWGKLRGNCRF